MVKQGHMPEGELSVKESNECHGWIIPMCWPTGSWGIGKRLVALVFAIGVSAPAMAAFCHGILLPNKTSVRNVISTKLKIFDRGHKTGIESRALLNAQAVVARQSETAENLKNSRQAVKKPV